MKQVLSFIKAIIIVMIVFVFLTSCASSHRSYQCPTYSQVDEQIHTLNDMIEVTHWDIEEGRIEAEVGYVLIDNLEDVRDVMVDTNFEHHD